MLKTNFQNDVKYQTAPKWPRKLQMINQCSHPPDGFFGGFLNRWFHIASTCQSTFLHQKGQAVPDPQTCRIISWRCDTLCLFHTPKLTPTKTFFRTKRTKNSLSLHIRSPFPLPFHPPTRWHFAILAWVFFGFSHPTIAKHLGICLRPAVSTKDHPKNCQYETVGNLSLIWNIWFT